MEWIKITDRLPTEKDADENGKVLVFRQVNESQKALSKSIYDWFMVKYIENGYWMSLPEPPKPDL